jgi:predicted RNA-binding Zn-ribbon protein involved in translation (DUF1610 family)
MQFRNSDGTPYSWKAVAPHFGALLIGAIVLFRLGLSLSWQGTIEAVTAAFLGAALFWGTFVWLGRKGPITLRLGSGGARATGLMLNNDKLSLACPHCGWRGAMSALTRATNTENQLVLDCPSCGHEIGHHQPGAKLIA